MVQTLKQCLKKCMAAGHDSYLVMLIYRATLLSSSLPEPAELLNGRRYRTVLLTRSQIQNANRLQSRWLMTKKEVLNTTTGQQETYPPLCMQQKVYVQVHPNQKQWTPSPMSNTHSNIAKTIHCGDQGWSPLSEIIWLAEETPQPDKTTNSVISSSNIMEQPRWEVKRPERLIKTR